MTTLYRETLKILAALLLLASPAALAQDPYDQLLHHWDYDKSASLNIKHAGVQNREGVSGLAAEGWIGKL